MQLLDEHVRELLNMSDDWEIYFFESLDGKCFKLIGAVAPLKKSGKNKGEKNWAKLDKATEKTVYITPDGHRVWMQQWETKTGKCSQCVGTGQELIGWSIKTGKVMRPCKKCSGSGNALSEQIEREASLKASR